jgi:RNA polymerase sigma-70 factor (ECF subfamily)
VSRDSLDLLARLKAGDREAIDALMRRNLTGLRSYVRLHSGPLLRAREASGDLVQSVCREVLEHMDRFRFPSEAGFRRWLYVTAMRKIRRRYEYWGAQRRDAGRDVHLDAVAPGGDLTDAYAALGTPSQVAMANEGVERIERAFDRLPEAYREAIVLARIVGLSTPELSERLGRTEGATRTMLSRATARLAELLDEESGGG